MKAGKDGEPAARLATGNPPLAGTSSGQQPAANPQVIIKYAGGRNSIWMREQGRSDKLRLTEWDCKTCSIQVEAEQKAKELELKEKEELDLAIALSLSQQEAQPSVSILFILYFGGLGSWSV